MKEPDFYRKTISQSMSTWVELMTIYYTAQSEKGVPSFQPNHANQAEPSRGYSI